MGGGAQMGRNRDRKRLLAPGGHTLLPEAEIVRNAWTSLDGTVVDGNGENGVTRESARTQGTSSLVGGKDGPAPVHPA